MGPSQFIAGEPFSYSRVRSVIFIYYVFFSDGIGRTGTFCALMLCHERLLAEHMADVFYAIGTVHAQRSEMVENSVREYYLHMYIVISGAI